MPDILSPHHAISVIGAGAWGSALALHFHRRGLLYRLHTSHQATMESIAEHGVSPHLEAIAVDRHLPCCLNIAEAAQAGTLLIASKLTSLEQTLRALAPQIKQQTIVLCTKGILDSGELPHQLAQRVLPAVPMAVLSGPSFAHDLASDLPVAVALAGTSPSFIDTLTAALWDPRLRIYPSHDIDGVAWCGALKNVLAIASGIARGLKVGSSGEAALITRGLAELRTLTFAAGARDDTYASLAGLGDLMLTCSSERSRNMRLGMLIAGGHSAVQARDNLSTSAEGYHTTRMIPDMAERYQISLPIMEAVHQVLYNAVSPLEAMKRLLDRRPSFVASR